MQRLFVPNEKKDENGYKKSSSSVYFYCIGKNFSLICPFKGDYRATHADFEPTGQNLLKHSFPEGTIRLFDSLIAAKTVARKDRKDNFIDLTPRVEYIDSTEDFCQVLQAEAIFKVSVDSIAHLKPMAIDQNKDVFHTAFPYFETSIDHISEIVSVSVAYDPDNGRGLLHAESKLSSLSDSYLQRKQVAFKK